MRLQRAAKIQMEPQREVEEGGEGHPVDHRLVEGDIQESRSVWR